MSGGFIPRPEHPRPDFYRKCWFNLNGPWQFTFDDENIGIAKHWERQDVSFSKEIIVPFCYQCKASGIGDTAYHPVMWYKRWFNLPPYMTGKRILLRFGAVDFSCVVYMNGYRVGGHQGGYTPFALDVTPFIIDGKNSICLRIEDERDCTQPRGKQLWKDNWFDCWYTATSGIWQTVYLEAVGNIYVNTAHITPDVDQGTATLQLTLSHIPQEPITATVKVSLNGRMLHSQSMTMTQRSQRMVLDMVEGGEITGFAHWTPDTPNLYDAEIVLSSGDQVNTYFGMRKIQVVDGMVLLNNHPLYQRLILDQGYWPESLLTPPCDDAIRADVEWTKKFGYNGARKHQKLEDPRYYYWADKLGLLVWEELPSTYEFTAQSIRNLSDTLFEGIERDFNHPSVIVWVPLNESWGVDRIYADKRMQATAEMLYDQVKALDGSRLVSTNDGWENLKTDIFALHDYAADGSVLAHHFSERSYVEKYACDHHMAYAKDVQPTSREAFILTEYGGIAIEENNKETWGYHDKVRDQETFFKRYQSLTDAVRAIPYCQGYVYTQLTDVQQEVNGLLTADRQAKIDVDRFRALTINPEGRYC